MCKYVIKNNWTSNLFASVETSLYIFIAKTKGLLIIKKDKNRLQIHLTLGADFYQLLVAASWSTIFRGFKLSSKPWASCGNG
jgi:hypothetical protein